MNLKKALQIAKRSSGDVGQLSRRFGSLESSERKELVDAMYLLLARKKYAANENLRISAVNILLSVSPENLSALWRLVRNSSSALSHEVQFTLFLFLSFAYDRANKKLRRIYVRMAEWHLMHSKSELGAAAYSSSYFLGHNHEDWGSVRSLCRVLSRSKYPAARKWAVAGLEYAINGAGRIRRRKLIKFLAYRLSRETDRTVHYWIASLLSKSENRA